MSVFYKHTVEDRLEVGKKLGTMVPEVVTFNVLF